jgi:hypothetical protein
MSSLSSFLIALLAVSPEPSTAVASTAQQPSKKVILPKSILPESSWRKK